MQDPADVGTRAMTATGLLPSVAAEPELPVQNDHDWHPENRVVDVEIDDLDESHLIRGYD